MTRSLLLLAFVLTACSQPAPTPIPSSTPTQASVLPSPTPSQTATISSTPSTFSIGDPQAGDAGTAASLVHQYEAALIAGRWRAAWKLLAPEEQTHSVSYKLFAQERSEFFKSVKGRYRLTVPSHNADEIRQWVVPDNFPGAPIYPATPDYDRAFLVRVDFPALARNNAGYEVLIAAPDVSEHWFLWQVR